MEKEIYNTRLRSALLKAEIAGIKHGHRCFNCGFALGAVMGALIILILS